MIDDEQLRNIAAQSFGMMSATQKGEGQDKLQNQAENELCEDNVLRDARWIGSRVEAGFVHGYFPRACFNKASSCCFSFRNAGFSFNACSKDFTASSFR